MARSVGGGRSGGSRSSGGRSMGGGSRSRSRSFSGGGRSGSIGSSSARRTPSGGGFSGFNNLTSNNSSNSNSRRNNAFSRFGYGGYGRTGGNYGGGNYRGGGCGCSGFLSLIIIIMIIGVLFIINGFSFSTSKKLNRDKYEGAVDSSKGYFTDTCADGEKFIDSSNQTSLISGFKTFYNKTGVFPHLYIIENLPSGMDASQYGDALYIDLFSNNGVTCEGNFLILYVAEFDDYYFTAGYDTISIVDDESIKLIQGKINNNWTSSSNNGDLAKIFGKGLSSSAKDIMSKSNSVKIIAIIVAGIVFIIFINVAFKFWKAKKAQLNKENEALEKILDKPLDTFGTSEMDDLTKKYDDN